MLSRTICMAAAALAAVPAFAASTTVEVDATDTVYPGDPGGSTPGVAIALNGETSLTFSASGGS